MRKDCQDCGLPRCLCAVIAAAAERPLEPEPETPAPWLGALLLAVIVAWTGAIAWGLYRVATALLG